ncbi:palmitoyltransferase ZDHHC15B [Drosophila miranda]|uniref:palmitoyltransferase ZDHHC15B n=1 Tax=Drosophila miranda TaxID=7229 RepID=UPI00143F49E6|nr:palmitoyltransferase ZDHHC15B [Drosophila miranda]
MISNRSQSIPFDTVPVVTQLALECLTEDRGDDRRQRRTCCGCFESIFNWIPVIFIVCLIVYSYYVYVWHLCLQSMKHHSAIVLGVVLFWYHLLLLMFLWSYWSSMWAKVMPIPAEWSIPDADWTRLSRANGLEERRRILSHVALRLPITMCDQNGVVRYCGQCRLIKPDRAHHCRTCQGCILKMDHHCPWVNSCVHFHNYKFFLLFLIYASLYCLYVLVTLLLELHHAWGFDFDNLDLNSLHTMIPIVLALIFTGATVILLGLHIYLLLLNRTTMESAHAPMFCIGGRTRKAFNLGCCANLCEVFGDRWYLWPLPAYSSRGDGLTFPLRDGSVSSASSADY